MTRYGKFLCLLSALLLSIGLQAQTSGCNSSYSRYGLGLLNDQSQGFNKAMGGVGTAIRLGNKVNMSNAASYSAIDSLSFIFDVGMTASFGQMKSGGTRLNVNNCTLDYVNAGFQVRKGLGMSFGFVPLTSIGYNFSSPDKAITSNINTTQTVSSSNAYYGEGGLHEAYLGAGWKAFKDLSIGANLGFIWGSYTHTVTPTFKEGGTTSSSYGGLNKDYEAQIKTWKVDLGLQYPIRLTRQDQLTVGATVGVGHRINSDAKELRYTSSGDSTIYTAQHPFDLPWSYSGGLAWQHKDNLVVAADFKYEQWGKCKQPVETTDGTHYAGRTGGYKDRYKVAVGAQYTPNQLDKHYWNRIQYRVGANFSTPYLIVNGLEGPREMSLTAGFGLPITNRYNNRSQVNVGFEWLNRKPSSATLITENYFVLNLGITFGERWFMKYKIN